VIALQPTGVESCLQGGGRLNKRWKPARCGLSLPNPDSSYPSEAVCSRPMCHMDRVILLCRRPLLFLQCYFALCI